jgi:taurine dioxygenase
MSKLDVIPLDNVGIEIRGFDLNSSIDDELAQVLRDLWLEHGIVLFRDQDITPERQIEFSRLFGPLEMHPLKTTRSNEYPELFTLVNDPEKEKFMTATYKGKEIVGRLDWHMDLHYTGKPNHGAVLRSVVCAEQDGMTGFGDLAKAYDALDADIQTTLQDLEVVYSFTMQRKHMRFVDLEGYQAGAYSPRNPTQMGFPAFADVVYPAVVTHPVTGRKVLEIFEQMLDRVHLPQSRGLSADEAIELLEELVAHTRKPEFHYFHQWRDGDMILWDNWRAMHCATGTPRGTERVIHRTTIEGNATLGRVLEA